MIHMFLHDKTIISTASHVVGYHNMLRVYMYYTELLPCMRVRAKLWTAIATCSQNQSITVPGMHDKTIIIIAVQSYTANHSFVAFGIVTRAVHS